MLYYEDCQPVPRIRVISNHPVCLDIAAEMRAYTRRDGWIIQENTRKHTHLACTVLYALMYERFSKCVRGTMCKVELRFPMLE